MRGRLKVGIDYRSVFHSPAGIGRFTREAIAALLQIDSRNEYLLYCGLVRRRRVELSRVELPDAPNVTVFARPVPGKLLQAAARVLPVSVETLIGPVDLFHCPDFVYPPVKRAPLLVTLHDLAFEVNPSWFPASVARRLSRRVRRAVGEGAWILTVSESSREEIVSRLPVREEQVHVAPLGVDSARFGLRSDEEVESFCKRSGIRRPYLLFVGTIQPRKNLARTLEAFRMARSRGMAELLVIAGKPGWQCESTLREIRHLEGEGAVRHLGYVAEEDLPVLYGGAAGFCYPSHHEGFGLPVLEAMAAGTPVLTSSGSALDEVAGDAALQVDPDSTDAIADGMQRLTGDSDLRRSLVERGRERVARFSWSACARRLLAVYREMVEAKG